LEYALYDLSQGDKIINVAMEYGFETHAGFTKAFKKYFGYPPSLYRLHITASPPAKATVYNVNKGVIKMQVEIKELTPFSVIGYASRHRMPNIKSIANLPGFYDTAKKDYAAELSTLFYTHTNFRHCEVILCLDVDEEHDCFTYMIGVGVDKTDFTVQQRPGTYRHDIPGGLHAVFTTPLAGDDTQLSALQDTWKYVLEDWLPGSEYEYDETRTDYEYHDERAHSDWRDDGKCCTEIRIPIRKRK
jgi:AraC family transcriptional regulator